MRLASVRPATHKSLREVVRRLATLGHRRIILLIGSGTEPTSACDEVEAYGIQVGRYNFPKWENGPIGFRRCLDSLFAMTPPTALIVDGAPLFLIAQHYLARRGVFAPEHVSLICSDPDPAFEWYEPSIAHIHWDRDPVVRRMMQWVANINCGKDDRRQTCIHATFVDGGTVGPAPMSK